MSTLITYAQPDLQFDLLIKGCLIKNNSLDFAPEIGA